MNDGSLLKKENRTCFAPESLITVKQYSSQRTDNAVLAKLHGDETAEGLKYTSIYEISVRRAFLHCPCETAQR